MRRSSFRKESEGVCVGGGVHVQKKTKGLLLKNIVGTVKKSYAQNALNGICGGRHLDLIM
jgi:hypothetical protein